MNQARIVVVGGGQDRRSSVAKALEEAGLRGALVCADLPVADEPAPDLVVVASGVGADSLVAEARGRPELAGCIVLAVVPPTPAEVAANALAAGADEVLVEPVFPAVLGNRVRALLRAAREATVAREAVECEAVLLRIQEVMSLAGDLPEGLRSALFASLDIMNFERASLIAHSEGSDAAYVIAATDDSTLSKFKLDIEAYPELREAIKSRAPLFIDDGWNHPLTAPVADALKKKGVRGLAVFPVTWHKRALGALLYRRAATGAPMTPRRLAFARLFAGALAGQLADGKVIAALREQTHRISRERYENERRLRAVDTLKEYFDAASDGVLVVDHTEGVLFVNRAAEAITGFARDGLLGTSLLDLVPEEQRDQLREVTRRVLAGRNLDPFDLDLGTSTGESVCVSVTTSTVLSPHEAAILLFRDVTAERSLETELRKTKDFLERLIDSTVDAIVASDIDGVVVLFNQGAERIMGYAAEDIVGKVHVSQLYPEGVARNIMRMLRSSSYGGIGRLEQTRRELLTAHGELVPVNMTASIVYEEGDEVATVGIFSDLRERIRIEQRLLQAQEKLMVSEKQAVVAELAGAAAHELNQPLTSILGYIELIERRMEEDARETRALGVIRSEAERMAEIVKKIGRITRYETKEYVGAASILDLDASAEPRPAGPSGRTED